MPRLSIKAKLSLVISILVLAFIAFNVGYYPRRVERQIRVQAETSARQVAETAGYALAPALGGGSLEDVSRVLEGVKNLPAFSFSVVFDAEGRQVDSTPSAPAWARNHADGSSLSRAFTRGEDGVLVATAPVFYREPHRDKVGTLVLGFTTEDLQRTLNANIRLGLYVGLAALGLGLAVAIFISNLYVHPVLQLTGVIPAARRALEMAGLSIRDMDWIEVNEAFASVALCFVREFAPDLDRLNPWGGAIAHGHPLGGSGAGLLAKMLAGLECRDGRFGLQVMCIGHGMATATVIERI